MKNWKMWAVGLAVVAAWYLLGTKKGKIRLQGMQDGSSLDSTMVDKLSRVSDADLARAKEEGIPLGYYAARLG